MKPFVLSLLVFAGLTSGLFAQGFFEARNSAMGGAGVASSRYEVAGFSNPALLTRFGEDDDFALVLPSVSAFADDETGLLKDLSDFVDEFDRVNARLESSTATQQDLDGLAARLLDLDGRSLSLDIGAGLALAVPSESLAWSLHARTFLDITSFTSIDPGDIAAIGGSLGDPELPFLGSEGRGVGVATSELGVSLAHRFSEFGLPFSIGVTPKFQRVDSINYGVSIEEYDEGDFDKSRYTSDDSAFNVDLGASLEPGAGFTLGLVIRDLISKEYDTVTALGSKFTYEIVPVATLGAAWTNDSVTLTADVDLNPRERLKDGSFGASTVRIDDDTQLWHFGAEFDLAHWVQFRVGYRDDFENTLDDVITGGIGFSPFDVFHLDLAMMYADQDSLGGAAQLSFTF